MAWRKGFLSLRKIDEAPQSIDDFWLNSATSFVKLNARAAHATRLV